MNGTIWGELDLAPTRDLRAIRKAYAARLKTIDAEADPQAFIALREAYERATLIASQPESGWADEDEDRADGETESAAEDDGRGRDPADPEERGWRIFSEMADILRDPERQDADLDADEQERLNALLADWLGWLQQVPIDLSRPYEWQLAHLVAGTIPRSDPLVEPACAWFGWDRLGGQWDTPPQIEQIVQRRQGNRAYAALCDPGHRWHKAFLSLTADEAEPFWKRPNRDDVYQLLQIAKTKYPSVHALFNGDRVDEWERRLRDGSSRFGRWAICGVLLLLFFVRAVTADISGSRSVRDAGSTPPVGLVARSPEPLNLQNAVGSDLPLEQLRAVNPDLVRALEQELGTAQRDRQTQDALRYQAQQRLNDAYDQGRMGADPPLLRDYWRLWLDRAEYYRAQRPSVCVDFMRGRSLGSDGGAPVAPLPEALMERQRAMRRRVLLMVKPVPRKAERGGKAERRGTMIPGAIMEKVMKQAGLSEARLGNAFKGEGSDADICLANLTLVRIVVGDQSKDAVRIMREM